MWPHDRTTVFGVELYAHKPWVVWNFNYLNQIGIGICANWYQASFFKIFQIAVIEFLPVTVTFRDFAFTVSFVSIRILFQVTGISA